MDNSEKKFNREEEVVYVGSEIKHGQNPIDADADDSKYLKQLYDSILPYLFNVNSGGKPKYIKLRLFDCVNDDQFFGYFDKLFVINSKEPNNDFLEFIKSDPIGQQVSQNIDDKSDGVFFRLVFNDGEALLPVFIDNKDVNIEIRDIDDNLIFST
jgi:hypothetical protein